MLKERMEEWNAQTDSDEHNQSAFDQMSQDRIICYPLKWPGHTKKRVLNVLVKRNCIMQVNFRAKMDFCSEIQTPLEKEASL